MSAWSRSLNDHRLRVTPQVDERKGLHLVRRLTTTSGMRSALELLDNGRSEQVSISVAYVPV